MKVITGKVISANMTNTVVVEVESFSAHPKYKKRIRRTRKFPAHDTQGAKVDQMVTLVEIRPMSKTKNWRVQEIVK